MRRPRLAILAAGLALALQGPVLAAAASAPARAASMSDLDLEIANAQREQQRILEQVRRDIAAMPILDPRKTDVTPAEREQEALRRQKLKLLAEIEKMVNAQNSRPWRRYISPSTQEPVYRDYYQAMARRIEEVGTRDFPTIDGQKVYGELTLNMTVDAKGRLIETEVVHGSGNALLDRKSIAIAHAAGPYGAFPAALRAKADQIVVTHRFHFVKGSVAPQAASSPGSGAQP